MREGERLGERLGRSLITAFFIEMWFEAPKIKYLPLIVLQTHYTTLYTTFKQHMIARQSYNPRHPFVWNPVKHSTTNITTINEFVELILYTTTVFSNSTHLKTNSVTIASTH